MIELAPTELAEVLWKTNQPHLLPLNNQDAATQAAYVKAADAAIAWMAEKAAGSDEQNRGLHDLLAGALAWKLLHPMQFNENCRAALGEYSAVAGENLSDEVKAAMKI